jgi:dihydrofolate synthase/folylpolyglutamate synthase
LEKKKILKGIEDAEWEGRLEVISHKPLMILDGSHNEEGAKALRAYIQDFIPSPLILVFGAMRDKAIGKMGRILFPRAQTVILTQLSSSRAASAEEIRALIPEFQARMILEPDPKTAYQTALNTASSQGNILFTGSLFLVGEIKKLTAKFPKGRPFL